VLAVLDKKRGALEAGEKKVGPSSLWDLRKGWLFGLTASLAIGSDTTELTKRKWVGRVVPMNAG
jgi:hypothetical protein